jgi:hypothetical protein
MPTATGQGEKVRENRLRRMAKRQGLRLAKSRLRDTRALGYDRWTVLDVDGSPSLPMTGFNGLLKLDEVEQYLNGELGPASDRQNADRIRDARAEYARGEIDRQQLDWAEDTDGRYSGMAVQGGGA